MTELLVNLGCGQTRPEGWVNVDSSLNSLLQQAALTRLLVRRHATTFYERPAQYMDLRRRWKFADAAVDVLYASHVLEHFSLSQMDHFFRESARCLKASGVIRIVVPDLRALAKIYVKEIDAGDDSAAERFLYAINMHAENTYGPDRNFLRTTVNLWQGYPHQHKYMHDAPSLQKILTRYGFHDLTQCSYGQSTHVSRIRDVESIAEGIPSVYIEGVFAR